MTIKTVRAIRGFCPTTYAVFDGVQLKRICASKADARLYIEIHTAKQEIKAGAAWWDMADYLDDLQERATASGLADTFRELLGKYTD